jgi:hypothetical protein
LCLNVKYAILKFQRIRGRDRSLKQRRSIVEYLLMPERVQKLEGQILGLSSQVKDYRSDVSQLLQILKRAVAIKENDSVVKRLSLFWMFGKYVWYARCFIDDTPRDATVAFKRRQSSFK